MRLGRCLGSESSSGPDPCYGSGFGLRLGFTILDRMRRDLIDSALALVWALALILALNY